MFWTLMYYGWFALIVVALFSIVGGAVWDAQAAKRRLAKARAAAEEAARSELPGEEEVEEVAADDAEAKSAGDDDGPSFPDEV